MEGHWAAVSTAMPGYQQYRQLLEPLRQLRHLVRFSYTCQYTHISFVQQNNTSSPSTSDPPVMAAGILTICLFCMPVSEGWLAFGEGTTTYPVISLSSENGHLRVSESARDGGGKEKAFNKGNDSLKIKNKNKGPHTVAGTAHKEPSVP